MASLNNFNNSSFPFHDFSNKYAVFEDEKSDYHFEKTLPFSKLVPNGSEKISNCFIQSLAQEKAFLVRETEKIEKEIRQVEVTKQLKALKVKDLRCVLERISEEDYSERFMDHRRLFTNEKKGKSLSLQGKAVKSSSTAETGEAAEGTGSEEQGSDQDPSANKQDHLSCCILYWSQVINKPVPKPICFRE